MARPAALVLATLLASALGCGGEPSPSPLDASTDIATDSPTDTSDASALDALLRGQAPVPDGSYAACGWYEDPVTCGPRAQCPANVRCIDSHFCRCGDDDTPTRCDGRPCTEVNCNPGEWYCARRPQRTPGRCATWPLRVQASVPSFNCSQPNESFVTQTIEALNALWAGQIRACPCQADAIRFGCANNAIVTPDSPGVIHYDPELLRSVTAMAGDQVAAALVLGHEAGHGVQLTVNQVSRASIQNELLADCFAGYLLAYQECQGQLVMSSFMAGFMSFCRAADAPGTPWWSPMAHGTCAQRQAALSLGVDGYRAGRDPAVQCRVQGM